MAALKSRNIIEAFQQPTVAMAVRELGDSEVLILLTGAVTKAMDAYFSPEQRLQPEMDSSFAEAVMEKYPHEALGDVPVFIKYAGWARYGKRNDDGTVTEKGKTYGRLTLTTLMDWWEQYVDEKAAEIEKVRKAELKDLSGGRNEIDGRVLEVMKQARAQETDPGGQQEGRRIARLMRILPYMGRDRMRHEWYKAPTKREKDFIYSEAVNRGYVAQWLEEKLKEKEQQP